MSVPSFVILQCSDRSCRFRFPKIDVQPNLIDCPRCGMPAHIVVAPYSSHPPRIASIDTNSYQLHGIFDNVRSAYNVGSMIRTASAAGARHLYMCGITPTPAQLKVSKTSLGAEKNISWSHHNNSVDLVTRLQAEGHSIIAVEPSAQSHWLTDFSPTKHTKLLTIIVGNEISGVDPALLELCDQVLALPMLGEKTSLNVTVAFGIAAYYLRFLTHIAASLTQDIGNAGTDESDAG